MSEEIKGWAAWHSVEGVRLDTISRSKQSAEDKMLVKIMGLKEYPGSHARAEAYFAMRDHALSQASGDNWKVRPVTITFQDEGGKNDTTTNI